MDSTEVLEAYDVLEIVEAELVAHLVAEVVAGGKSVACVDTYANAAFVVDALDDAGDVFELPAEVGTLSGGVLDDGGDTFGLSQGGVHLSCYLVEAFLFAYLVEVAARVEIEHGQTKLFGTFHLIEECIATFLQGLFVG